MTATPQDIAWVIASMALLCVIVIIDGVISDRRKRRDKQ